MKNIKLILLFYVVAIITSCNNVNIKNNDKKSENMKNPLLEEFNTPYGVPPFNDIKPSDYLPAIKQAIQQHNAEINKIINNKENPTFKNTIEALDYSGELLDRIMSILENLTSAETNDSLQKVEKEVSPIITEHYNNISLNNKLFKRIKSVYDNKEKFKLNTEQNTLLEKYYKDFTREGALLNDSDKAKLKEINKKLAMLSIRFGDNVLAETNSYKLIISDKNDLKGLPQSVIDAAADKAKEDSLDGKWVFTIQKPSFIPFLMYSEKRELRKQIQDAYLKHADNDNKYDNKQIIKDIIRLRHEKANILGYKNYAYYVLEENMAKTPDKVYSLINKLMKASVNKAIKEREILQNYIKSLGDTFKLQYYDWWYYAEKYKKQKYNFNDEVLKPYFELNNVRNGAFMVANKLYGINFKEIKNIPVYNPDVKTFLVTDTNNVELGILYMDFFVRPGKSSGAWMTAYRKQYKKDGKNVLPIISTVFNFSRPSKGNPSLLTLEEVETVFHEFGHSLQGLLSKCTYKKLSGTSVAQDFVELPSQVMENWASDPQVLKLYAKNYKTGEIMPDSLIKKIEQAQQYNQGFATTEYLSAAILDMDWHTKITDFDNIDVRKFENESIKNMGLIPEIKIRYRSTYFSHIFQGGYAVGYYGYVWAAILDADAFQAFKETGDVFNKKYADAFRSNILEKGGTVDPMKLYVNFRGRQPKIDALMQKRGLE